MIPIRLRLHHFLSYQSAVLDLTGIHTACICGPNGAGKSALLEALTWGIWGQSRASNDDDLIRKGSVETQVEVVYQSREHTYRILRSRSLNGSSQLEWQIQQGSGWRSLTRKGIRATQQAIQAQLCLDYDTFINSAYLRQGRADEFTIKRPGERKQILADILKLSQYEVLADRCRDQARAAKVQGDFVHKQLQGIRSQRADMTSLHTELEALQHRQDQLESDQQSEQEQYQHLKTHLEQRIRLQESYQDLTQQLTNLTQSLQSTESQWREQRQYQQDLQNTLNRETLILTGAEQYDTLFEEDQRLNDLFQRHQSLVQHQHHLQAQLTQHRQDQMMELHSLRTKLATLEGQRQSDHHILQNQDRIEEALQALRHARAQLTLYDQKQLQARPLQAQRQTLLATIQQERTQLQARHTLLTQHIQRLKAQCQELQQTEQAVLVVEAAIADLEKQRQYQQWVTEKIQERQLFVHELQERQRSLQRHWQRVDEKCQLLHPIPVQTGSYAHRTHRADSSGSWSHTCPLCTQTLSDDLRKLVLDKHQQEHSDLEAELLVIREQLAVADREIELLQREQKSLAEQLKTLDTTQQTKGRLQHQLESSHHHQHQLDSWQQELTEIETVLAQEAYADDLQHALRQIEGSLADIGYDEKDHALYRNEVDRWRWAETKWSDVQKALNRRQRLDHDIETLQATITDRQTAFEQSPTCITLRETLETVTQSLDSLNYDVTYHQHIRSELTQMQPWLQHRDALYQAHQHLPTCQDRCQALVTLLQQQRQTFTQLTRKLDDLHHQLSQSPVVTEAQLKGLDSRIRHRRQQLDALIAKQGAVQEKLDRLEDLTTQETELTQQLQHARRHYQVQQELTVAFGRNGIPALIIENTLPELEAEANRILSRLTANQLHLRFVTQRTGRRSSKLIDTLDILIADPQGTRPYETYSGGEAFRINFAIRLALSQLLAQRSGAHLQTLLIDEGFGSQDQTGRQHLVAAINAVAADFARILIITHIPALRDAFPHRIEVSRSPTGSSSLQVTG